MVASAGLVVSLIVALAVIPYVAATGALPAPAGDAWPQLQVTLAAADLNWPTAIAGDGSGRLFVAERSGRVRILRDGRLLDTPFLDISARVRTDGERGLLGLAFPPNYAERRHFYVFYVDLAGDSFISRFRTTADPDRADPNSEEVVLRLANPTEVHLGGQLAFGPRDGDLYIAVGDGGPFYDPDNRAQNPGDLHGKILRLDVETGSPATYTVPPTNPFSGRPGYRGEVWALGLRNPWRFSFDRLTGDLYIGDVGEQLREEIDFQPASGGGENYGWRAFEGTRCTGIDPCDASGRTFPVAEYARPAPECAVIGGYVYRGSGVRLPGTYLYGDYCSGEIWGLRREGGSWLSQLLYRAPFRLSTFGEDEAGRLYLAAFDARSGIYLLSDGSATPTPTATATPLPTCPAGPSGTARPASGRSLNFPILAGGTCQP